MKHRSFVRIADDAQLEQIDSIAEQLRSSGMGISQVEPITGQITGTADDADLSRLRSLARKLGADFVTEDEDVVHRLPDPSSDLQ